MATETLTFPTPRHLNLLYCGQDALLHRAEEAFDTRLTSRDNWLEIQGNEDAVAYASEFFKLLDTARAQGIEIKRNDYLKLIDAVIAGEGQEYRSVFENPVVLPFRRMSIVPKTVNQKRYLQCIQTYDVVFGVGPAGTGKTYLAVAAALHALQERQVRKVIITRPAVEAGEALGFLPGDLQEKLEPYLRPIYDGMNDMIGKDEVGRMMEKGLIEIAPLAYMRGRTLSEAFIILDEAQNTTPEQMMMFLTRLGENSRMVVTGDITQIDLPRKQHSGLKQATDVLAPVEGIKLFYFETSDVVRHPLVTRIIQAYENFQNRLV
ncbi:MAG: PhoH family protein [Opitutales bacterium]